jgi:catechol 2,3-dioxygenase-like lactoylglutathione lyase family enzyme
MKRFHVHVAVTDLTQSIRFYSQLFASEPSVLKPDYAKWMLDDPRINFAISQRASGSGVNHLGLQVDNETELEEVHDRLLGAEGSIVAEKGVACCYSRSDKYWITDPQGVAWETFRSLGTVPFYGQADVEPETGKEPCCATEPSGTTGPAPKVVAKGCCAPAAAIAGENACC